MIMLLDMPNPAGLAKDPLDALIVAVILLFILSTITEKFTELIRMYPYQSKILGIMFCIFLYIEIILGIFYSPKLPIEVLIGLIIFNILLTLSLVVNLFYHPDPKLDQKKGEIKTGNMVSRFFSAFNNVSKIKENVDEPAKIREVTLLSFLIGLLVTFLFNASLFNFFDTSNVSGLKPVSPFSKDHKFALDPAFFNFSFIALIGYLLTAFFLAFGAKFFHDLLDNLLQVKNLKRKLNEKADYDFDNIEEFDNYLKAQERPLFEAFLRKNLEGSGVFFESKFPEMEVVIHQSKQNATIPDTLFYRSAVGKSRKVKITVKSSPEIKTLSTIFASSNIANQTPVNNMQGTLAYLVKSQTDDKPFFLTCYHVIWNGHNWDNFDPSLNATVVHPKGGAPIGKTVKAIKNRLVDAALITPASDVNFQGMISGIGQVNKSRVLDAENDLNIGVKMSGSNSGPTQGYISEFNKCAEIRYPDGELRILDNLILIKPIEEGKSFSKAGDSGSLIVDSFNVAIAMLVAGNETDISLAIPFSTLRDHLNIKI